MLSRRSLRHWKFFVKTTALALVPLFLGLLAGACMLESARLWLREGRIGASIVAFVLGWVVTSIIFPAVKWIAAVVKESDAQMRRADAERCPKCDEPVQKPCIRDNGRLMCLPCARAGWVKEMPERAREAGA